MVKFWKPLPLPARRKPSSSHGRYSSIAPGTKPIGSQPSAISAVSLTVLSLPVAEIDRDVGFMCRIDFSGLASPAEPSPV